MRLEYVLDVENIVYWLTLGLCALLGIRYSPSEDGTCSSHIDNEVDDEENAIQQRRQKHPLFIKLCLLAWLTLCISHLVPFKVTGQP